MQRWIAVRRRAQLLCGSSGLLYERLSRGSRSFLPSDCHRVREEAQQATPLVSSGEVSDFRASLDRRPAKHALPFRRLSIDARRWAVR